MASVELVCDPNSLAEARRRLRVDDLGSLFALKSADVVVELQLDKTYLTLNRTFSVFATARVDGDESKWLLGFDYPQVYLQQVTVVLEKRKEKRGAREFAQLASHLQKAGYTSVDTEGVRNPPRKMNPNANEYGYNALPKWGFNGPIPTTSKTDMGSPHCDLETIGELLLAEGGEAVWKDVGDTCVLRFDLANDSQSWRILINYIEESPEDTRDE